MRRDVLTLVTITAAGACSLDWDALDPRGVEPTATVGAGPGSSTTGGGGNGGTHATGGAGGNLPTGPWFDPGLSRRRALTVEGVDETLKDFPVLVALDASRIDHEASAPDGSDLRFEADGELLAHDIDHWDAEGISTVWVRLPRMTSGATFTMYYGGTATKAPLAPSNTWSANYVAVWHLDGDGADASENGLDGNPQGVSAVPGLVGLAYDFDLLDEGRVDIPSTTASANAFVTGGTVSAAVRARTLGDNDRGRILDRSGSTTFAGGWGLSVTDTNFEALAFGHDYDMNFGYWLTPPETIAFDRWQHVAATANVTDQTVSLYIDGAAVMLNILQSGMITPEIVESHMISIGSRPNGDNRSFDGLIDEVRLSSVARSAAWMAAEAAAARDELITYGDEEAGPP